MGTDSDAEAFHATIHNGHGSVWQHWKTHFAQPYAKVPGLEPLPAVYDRPENSTGHVSSDYGGVGTSLSTNDQATAGRIGRTSPKMKGRPVISHQGVAR